ncbi:hypothetical protein MKW94_010367 [Papaver nudicaule]|uniref:FAD-binding domain-containing protein n=1 Tax=Papaver nudicaule TaxID=74823 RepID=A0AA41SK72_PAPNU|nr:hypothetical protein [Papaver nudicaule]
MENVVMKEEVVIVGGGIAGLATALALKRVGVKSLVLERSNELRVTGAALTLFSNAWIALESLGVAHKLTSAYKPYEGGQVTDVASGVTKENTLTKNYKGEEWQATGLRAIHRRALLEALLEELPTDAVRFSSKLRSVEKAKTRQDNDSFGVIVHLEDGASIHTKVLIGCDGVHSVVSKWLGLKDVVHSGRCAVRGLGIFPEGHGLQHQIQQFVDTGRSFKFFNLIEVLGRHIGNSYIRNGRTISQEDIEVEIEMYVKERRWRTAGLITASYLSGWVQQSGSSSIGVGWLMKFLRDTVFYKIVSPRVSGLLKYDCGKLPTASS